MKYLVRFLLLAIGFALTTAGLMFWHAQQFSLEGLWFFDNGFQLHPLHLLIVGLAMIPPALWEVFILEHKSANDG
ncbi:MAG: hypothetical protein ACE1Y4_09950 [Lysobacterales bacterium]